MEHADGRRVQFDRQVQLQQGALLKIGRDALGWQRAHHIGVVEQDAAGREDRRDLEDVAGQGQAFLVEHRLEVASERIVRRRQDPGVLDQFLERGVRLAGAGMIGPHDDDVTDVIAAKHPRSSEWVTEYQIKEES